MTLLLALSVPSLAATITVDPSDALAYATIQDGINAATDGDTVEIAGGKISWTGGGGGGPYAIGSLPATARSPDNEEMKFSLNSDGDLVVEFGYASPATIIYARRGASTSTGGCPPALSPPKSTRRAARIPSLAARILRLPQQAGTESETAAAGRNGIRDGRTGHFKSLFVVTNCFLIKT